MKIVYFVSSLYVGGAETLAVNYLEMLKELGHDVVLVEEYNVDSFLEDKLHLLGIKILTLCHHKSKNYFSKMIKRVRLFLEYKAKWKKIIKEEKPDIIHVHGSLKYFFISAFPPNQLFFTFHADFKRNLAVNGHRHRKRLFEYAKKGSHFIALSSKMNNEIKEVLPTNNVTTIPNGIDFKKVLENQYDRNEILKQLHIPANALVIGNVGRFHGVKNHERLVDIFNVVNQLIDNSFLIFIGDGDSSIIESLKQKIADYKLGERVRFLGLRNDAYSFYKCFDVFVLTSFSESFSLVSVEAQIIGTPCILSDCVPAEIICRKNCTALSLKETNECWANSIIKHGGREKEQIIEEFDVNSVVKKTALLYEKEINKNHAQKD